MLFTACKSTREYPILFIDEANKAFKAAQGDTAAAARVLDELDLFTRITKQEGEHLATTLLSMYGGHL